MAWEPKFKVGDKVRIIHDLKENNHFPGITPEMLNIAGMEVTIVRVPATSNDYYRIEEDFKNWNWTEDWFEDSYPDPKEVEESEILSLFVR